MATRPRRTYGGVKLDNRKSMKPIKAISRVMAYFSAGFLAVMMLMTVLDIFTRYFFNHPIPGAAEAAEYMMVCLVFFGLAWCGEQGRHIKVELIVSRLRPRVQTVFDIITHTLGLVVCIALSWQTFLESFVQRRSGFTSSILKVPAYPFYWIEALGYAVLALFILTVLAGKIGKGGSA